MSRAETGAAKRRVARRKKAAGKRGSRPSASPMRHVRDETVHRNKRLEVTMGRRTRSILVTGRHPAVLSAFSPETIAQRLEPGQGGAAGASA